MKDTYDAAMGRVYTDEGGYSNDAGDPGGPTNWGITIHDARQYWKANASADDVRHMPKSIAAEIYAKHYANPLHYDDLPPGLDYAVLDYGINSGISRAADTLQRLVGTKRDGVIGPQTLAAVKAYPDMPKLISDYYDTRMAFLRGLNTWNIFGGGWSHRVIHGKSAALNMWANFKDKWQAKPKAPWWKFWSKS